MKKVLLALVVVAVGFALTTKIFADNPTATTTTTATTAKPTTTATTTTAAATKPTTTTTTATVESALKGSVTLLDATTVKVKDNSGKEWAFKVGTVNVKDCKVGDNVEVRYEKDSLKSIAKAK